jgi:hypothetical protein
MISTPNIYYAKALVNKKKENKFIFFYILIFCLSDIQFFAPVIISTTVLYFSYYALFLFSVGYVLISYKESYNNSFTLPITLILVGQIIAVFSASYSWHQNLISSLLSTSLNMSYLLFFLLVINKFKLADTEKIIIICGVLYIVIYLVSFLIFPRNIVSLEVEYADERGFQRILINGIGFLFLFSFYSLKNYMTTHKQKWLLIYAVCLVLILMTLTRTLIIFSILFSFLYYIRGKNIITILLALLLSACLLYIITQTSYYKILAADTKSQAAYIKDDVRQQSKDYYLYNFSTNNIARVFGNGDAYKNTDYMRYMVYLEQTYGFYETDIGYAGFYVKYGLLAILGYLLFFYRTIKVAVSEEYQYCKYFLYFIFAISVIIESPFSRSYIPAIVCAAYILSTDAAKKKPAEDELDTISYHS